MALVFPRDLPAAFRAPEEDFRITRYMQVNPFLGGTEDVIERADPRWVIRWSSGALDRARFQEFEAWLESLYGGARDFLAFRRGRKYPINYAKGFDGLTVAGGGAFDGTASLTAIAPTGFSVEGLPAGFALRAGDMVGLVEAGRYGLHMLTEDVTAVAGAAALTVQPFVKTNMFTLNAVVNFAEPKCRAILRSWDGPRSLTPRPITIEAYQRIF